MPRGTSSTWELADVRASARHRLYRATVAEIFVLDDRDQRIPVPGPGSLP